MASEMVERLAKKWDDAFAGQEYPDDDPERHEVACADVGWWLNAIADEIEKEWGKMTWCRLLVTWLRAQAGEAPGDD